MLGVLTTKCSAANKNIVPPNTITGNLGYHSAGDETFGSCCTRARELEDTFTALAYLTSNDLHGLVGKSECERDSAPGQWGRHEKDLAAAREQKVVRIHWRGRAAQVRISGKPKSSAESSLQPALGMQCAHCCQSVQTASGHVALPCLRCQTGDDADEGGELAGGGRGLALRTFGTGVPGY